MIRPSRPGVAVRAAVEGDRPLLRGVYASAREDELAPVPWSSEQKQAFLDLQFEAQDREYRARYADAAYLVVLVGSEPAGRLYLARYPGELRIVDLALLPRHRGHGVGTSLVRDVVALAASEARIVSLHVERWNPARRLYERLGFTESSHDDVYLRMEHSTRPG